jgi:hypothetical protein
MTTRPSAPRLRVAGVAVALVLVVATALWLLGRSGSPPPPADASGPSVTAAAARPSASTTPTTSATAPTASTAPTAPTAAPAACGPVAHPLRPRTIDVPGVGRAIAVVTPPRLADGVPGAPPLTATGKRVFAWDREQGIRPGDPAGNVLLNAHTWPDGSALGNRLLAGLQTGDRIVVAGSRHRLCYRVTERVQVLATDGLARYYDTDGPPQLAIIVCSGRRTGPGVWTHRTVWFASPSA